RARRRETRSASGAGGDARTGAVNGARAAAARCLNNRFFIFFSHKTRYNGPARENRRNLIARLVLGEHGREELAGTPPHRFGHRRGFGSPALRLPGSPLAGSRSFSPTRAGYSAPRSRDESICLAHRTGKRRMVGFSSWAGNGVRLVLVVCLATLA